MSEEVLTEVEQEYLGKRVRGVQEDGTVLEGLVFDITNKGKLRFRTNDGKVFTADKGDMEVVEKKRKVSTTPRPPKKTLQEKNTAKYVGKVIRMRAKDDKFQGTVVDVREDGMLVADSPMDEGHHILYMKDVRIYNPAKGTHVGHRVKKAPNLAPFMPMVKFLREGGTRDEVFDRYFSAINLEREAVGKPVLKRVSAYMSMLYAINFGLAAGFITEVEGVLKLQ